jgi:hypothetical protein
MFGVQAESHPNLKATKLILSRIYGLNMISNKALNLNNSFMKKSVRQTLPNYYSIVKLVLKSKPSKYVVEVATDIIKTICKEHNNFSKTS